MSINLKGFAFEYFVRRMLLSCGFTPVKSDGFLVFDKGIGQMIHGQGYCHNADVLVNPPLQTPFYYPTRLIVECKCYNDTLGIEFARNVLGLREDINNFEIVTVEILNNRKSSHTTKNYSYPVNRYLYQVALASVSGFKKTTLAYADAHKIPLISFGESRMFKRIKKLVQEIGDYVNDEDKNFFREKFLDTSLDESWLNDERVSGNDKIQEFLDEVNKLTKQINIGLLDNGMILFLMKKEDATQRNRPVKNVEEDSYTIHWTDENKEWCLSRSNGDRLFFELPHELMLRWKNDTDRKEREAMEIKKQYMSQIVLYPNTEEDEYIHILKMNGTFLNEINLELGKIEDYETGVEE